VCIELATLCLPPSFFGMHLTVVAIGSVLAQPLGVVTLL